MRKYLLSLLVVGLMVSGVLTEVTAAEIRGTLRGADNQRVPPGTEIEVSCGAGHMGSVPLRSDGSYSVRGLPAGRGCQLTIRYQDGSTSEQIPFSTGRSVVLFNAELRKYRNRILVFRR